MRFAAFLVGLCVVAGTALALPEAPKPGPEVARLAMFAGKWTGESDIKPSPFGPGGKMTSADDCAWYEGGYQLVCQGTSSGVMGPMKGTSVMGWSAGEKTYKWMGYDSNGMMSTATGVLKDKTWTWSGKDKMGEKTIWSHYVITETSPTSYNFKWEMSEDGATWKTIMEGKSAKQ